MATTKLLPARRPARHGQRPPHHDGDRAGPLRPRARGRPPARADRPADHRRRRGARAGARGQRGPGHLAHHGRAAVPHPAGRLRAAPAQVRQPGPEPGRNGRGRRRRRDRLRAGRRGVRHRRRHLRRVRRAPTGQARRQAGEPLLRAGGRRAGLRAHRAAGRPRPRTRPGRRRRCWSSARPEAWAASPCRSPRRSAPRSPACAAPRRSTWSAPSAPTTSSTTPARTSPTAGTATTSILDIGGNRRLSRAPPRPHPARDGWSSSAARPAGGWLGGSDRQIRAHAAVAVRRPEAGHLHRLGERRRPDALRELIEAGTVTPAVDRTYPLGGVAAAIRHLLDGRARGKLVVSVAPTTTPTPDAGSAA